MLTNKNLVYKELKLTSKLEVLESIGNKLVENKIIDDKTELVEAFIEREKQFSTGIGEGIAIPHAEISGIEEPQVVVVGLKDIDWESMDGSPVKTAVGIIVPKGGRGDHMTIIAELSKKMVDGDFLSILKSGTEEEIVNLINDIKLNTEEASETKESKTDNKDSKYIIGITACPTGIAHTFMAQQKLMDAAKELGYEVKIETQGSDGQKNALTVEDIRRADGIVIASAIQLSGMERFDGYEDKMLKIPVAQAIKDNFGSISTAMEMAKQFNSDPEKVKKAEAKSNVTFADEKESWVKVVVGHTMSGISAMILLLSLTGLLLAVGNIGALPWTLNSDVSKWIGDAYWATYNNWWVNLMYYMAQMGSLLMKFIYPIFAMYCAYSIGGRLALMPGFFGGMMAGGLESYFINDGIYTSNLLGWAYPNGFIPSMFFGALFIGFFAGYCVKFLNNKIQVSPNFISLKTMLIVPFAMSMIVFIVMAFAINPLFGLINWGMSEFFRAAGTSGALVYHASISAGMAFDLGGPVNKAANALATSSAQSALDGLQVAYTDWVDAGRLTSGVEYDAVQAAADNMLVFNSTSR